MIIFNLTIAIARLDTHKSADNLLREIANVLHVDKGNVVLSSVYGRISEYRLGVITEGSFLNVRTKECKVSTD